MKGKNYTEQINSFNLCNVCLPNSPKQMSGNSETNVFEETFQNICKTDISNKMG